MLLNQASFRARLNQLSNWSKKDRSNFAVLLLTLDRFPGIKASMGQLVGKQLRKAVAEDTGLIGSLGWWILRSACQQMKQWQQRFPRVPPLTIAVNLSGKQFSEPNIIEKIDEILQEIGLDARSLKLEITETVLMDNPNIATVLLEQLKQRQIQLCIDDFGTGYSSLSYLQRFPANTLKIDRSFVKQIDLERKTAAIMQIIMMLANNLEMNVIAEGIETDRQLWQLKALQCEYGQGYFFSKPLPPKAVEELLADWLL